MAPTKTRKRPKTSKRKRVAGARKGTTSTRKRATSDVFEQRKGTEPTADAESLVHIIRPGVVCDTEPRGHVAPRGRSRLEIVVDASEGFVPLWAKNTTLHWRFRERSMTYFKRPAAAKNEIRKLLGEALLLWGSAVPVKFKEDEDIWDFEIVMRKSADCDASGCTLASAFFPDGGRHQLVLYPTMFQYSREDQIETLVHEVGHMFGLRHFFAKVSEAAWPSQIFGTHSKFSIMNYGTASRLTNADKSDLKRLYQLAWSGALTEINGTPIRFVQAFHTLARATESMVAVGPFEPVPELQPRAALISGL